MKGRLAKQIQQINECLVMFNSAKAKCDSIISSLNLENTIMIPFDDIKKLFNIDLKILDLDHLLTRKQKLLIAIDDIGKLESKLRLKMIRSKQLEKYQLKPEINHQLLTQVEEKQQQKALKYIQSNHTFKQRLPQCEVELTSKCAQLLDVWVKNKGSPSQNIDDKFDRLSKIIGILKKNIKQIYQQQKSKASTISFQDCQQFNNVKNSYEKTKHQNLQLKVLTEKLIQQNTRLKKNMKYVPQTTNAQAQTAEQIITNPQESFIESKSDMFDNFYKRDQYCEDQVLRASSISDSLIEQIIQQQSEDSCEPSQINSDFHSGILTFSKKINNQQKVALNKCQQLNYVQNKLKEIKKNRKRIAQDDNLWAEMENII